MIKITLDSLYKKIEELSITNSKPSLRVWQISHLYFNKVGIETMPHLNGKLVVLVDDILNFIERELIEK